MHKFSRVVKKDVGPHVAIARVSQRTKTEPVLYTLSFPLARTYLPTGVYMRARAGAYTLIYASFFPNNVYEFYIDIAVALNVTYSAKSLAWSHRASFFSFFRSFRARDARKIFVSLVMQRFLWTNAVPFVRFLPHIFREFQF